MSLYRLSFPQRAVVAVIFALLSSGCSRSDAPEYGSKNSPVAVHVAVAELRQVHRHQPVAGTLRPADHAIVSARIMGTITGADFTLGRRVAAGEPLLTINAAELNARLEQAQAVLSQAVRDHEREAGLLTKGVVTSESVRALADHRSGAEAAVQEAKVLLSYTRVTSPFQGIITRKYIQNGDLATLGEALFAIEAECGLRAEVEVPASLPDIVIGTSVSVQLSAFTTNGTLTEFSPAADPISRTRLAKLSLPTDASNTGSGDFVRVLWPAGESAAITVPIDAVCNVGQMERVYVVTAGRAQLRLVKTSGITSGRLIVAAGLEAGETVILASPASLKDGQVVEIQP